MAPPLGFIPWNKGLKGIHLSPATEFKKGERRSPKTEFKKGHKPSHPIKKGQRIAPKTEFRKGQIAWNKGIEYKQITWEKHPQFKYGHTKYRAHVRRNGKKPICEKCGEQGKWDSRIHVHHIDHNRKNNEISNLMILCVVCHNRLHKNWKKRKSVA